MEVILIARIIRRRECQNACKRPCYGGCNFRGKNTCSHEYAADPLSDAPGKKYQMIWAWVVGGIIGLLVASAPAIITLLAK